MSKKGENKKLKSLNAPRAVQINRKQNVWTVRTRAGTHKAQDSVSLGIILRNHLKIAETIKEAKIILNANQVKVNGTVRKDYRFSIGLFDVIEVPKNKIIVRAVFDNKRRIQLKEIDGNPEGKISRVAYKISTKKGVQITTNDGKVLIDKKAKVGDSLNIDMNGKIKEVLPLKEGAVVYITRGTHCSEKGKVKEIVQGTITREKLVKIEQEDSSFETIADNIIVIGEKEEAIGNMRNL